MATDLSGLFGGSLTPEEQQQQLLEARAAQFAQLNPSQQLAFMGYKAGSNLGQGLAQAAGVDIQDPAIKRASMLRQMAQGIDVTTTKGLEEYANRLQQAGMSAEANKLAEAIQQRKLTEAKTGAEVALTEQRLREKAAADPFEQLIRSGKYTPDSVAKYKTSKDPADLELVEKLSQPEIQKLQDYRDSLKDPKKIAEVDAVIKAAATGKGTNISLSMTQDKGINKNKTDLAGDVEQAALNAPDRIQMAGSVRNLVNKAFTGFGSEAGLKAAQVLEASGIAVKGTSESEQLDQLLNEMTIGTAGSLKGALSDKDREFVKQTIGTRGLTKATLQYVADELERRARVDEALNKEVNDYKGNLNDFNFAEARSRAVKSVNERQAKEKRLRELERKAAGGQ